jgi:predicted nucleotidyltransferase
MTSDAVVRAHDLVAEHVPGALVAILAGSTARGQATGTSDLDIAVLVHDGAGTRRETLRCQGLPVELFVHTRVGLTELFAADAATRRGTMQHMYAEGVVVIDQEGEAARLQAWAQALLAEGPAALGLEAVETGRYALTDALDDLTDAADRFEQLAVATAVLQSAADLLLDHHRAWTGAGKWLPRRLLAADADRGTALLEGHLRLCETADPTPLLRAATHVLHLVGGPLSKGYYRTWPGNGPAVHRPAAGQVRVHRPSPDRSRDVRIGAPRWDLRPSPRCVSRRRARPGQGRWHGLRLGKAQAPIRVAVTGRTVGLPLFESLEILGRERVLARIDVALGRLEG